MLAALLISCAVALQSLEADSLEDDADLLFKGFREAEARYVGDEYVLTDDDGEPLETAQYPSGLGEGWVSKEPVQDINEAFGLGESRQDEKAALVVDGKSRRCPSVFFHSCALTERLDRCACHREASTCRS